jgi:hypothetical protein
MGVDLGSAPKEALPFQKGEGAPVTQKVPSSPPPPAEPASASDDSLKRTGAIDPDIVAKALAGAVPFGPKREAPAAAAPPVDAARPPAPRAPSPAAGFPVGPQIPPPPGAAPSGTRFPINLFASLTAEIAEAPANAAAIRARYGITEEVHREESRRWTDAFERDPALRDRYLGIVKRYRSYLQSGAKK